MNTRAFGMQVKTQQGIALIEALIAMLLFSLGILALVGLQASMTKNVTQSKLRGEASYLANQLIGQMWVDQANLSSYAVASGTCTAGSFAKCTSWLNTVQKTLPSGSAQVTINAGVADITLTWTLPHEEQSQLQIQANIIN